MHIYAMQMYLYYTQLKLAQKLGESTLAIDNPTGNQTRDNYTLDLIVAPQHFWALSIPAANK